MVHRNFVINPRITITGRINVIYIYIYTVHHIIGIHRYIIMYRGIRIRPSPGSFLQCLFLIHRVHRRTILIRQPVIYIMLAAINSPGSLGKKNSTYYYYYIIRIDCETTTRGTSVQPRYIF